MHGGGNGGGPYFEHLPYDAQTGEGGRNLTTVEGGRAVLTCVIRNLERNSTVSESTAPARTHTADTEDNILPQPLTRYGSRSL